MVDRRANDGFSVAPQRLGGGDGPRRGRGLWVALVIAAAAAIVSIAWLGPRLSDRPNFDVAFFATPTPTATRADTSTEPSSTELPLPPGLGLSTPLPEITRPDGPPVSGRVAIETDALHVIDLATGTNVAGPPAQFGRDAVFRAPDHDGWICICFDDQLNVVEPNRVVEIVGVGAAGGTTDTTRIGIFRTTAATETEGPGLTTDIDVFDGGRHALLAMASRTGNTWRLSVATIDVVGRRLGPTVDLGSLALPGATPSPGPSASFDPGTEAPPPSLDGPHVRISPDGRVAFVWSALLRYAPGTAGPVMNAGAWRIPLGPDAAIGAVGDAPGLRTLPAFCNAVGFASADRLAWLCPRFAFDQPSTGPGFEVGTVDLDGRTAGRVALEALPNGWFGEPLFDRANGQVYAWDSTNLRIARIDVRTMAVTAATFDPVGREAPGGPAAGGADDPDWRDADSAVQQFGSSSMSGGRDVADIYALGFDPEAAPDSGAQATRGIFVIDRFTLSLVDRWAAAADYIGITTLADGNVAAAGATGVNERGHFAPWEASLTIHRAMDGRILVRFGRLGDGNPALVVDR